MNIRERTLSLLGASTIFLLSLFQFSSAQEPYDNRQPASVNDGRHTLYDIPPRTLVDLPTAGTLPRANFNIGVRLYQNGGGLGYTDIGLSNRFQLGISFGGDNVLSNRTLNSNPRIGFSLKFRIVDELAYLPAMTVGFTDQGMGNYSDLYERYTFKSRGFYAVASRNFYFFNWTSGWHLGINYSLENKIDADKEVNLFAGFDATFYDNMAFLVEYDAAFNDDNGTFSEISGRGRGYMNMSLKWLFTENLEIEIMARDLFVNRREAETFAREMRIVYIDHF
ncbi:MAG: YjbH domain-containing protein [candidate division Zixibacteria bacterium]|nr:YjbH domain-containing protein [candidate division Zixibacteria bacterium]